MLILASKSPRRRELLSLLTTEFEIDVSNASEPEFSGGEVSSYVCELARIKAREVAGRHPGDIVIGADTVGQQQYLLQGLILRAVVGHALTSSWKCNYFPF
jgi:septum formation protein